jgi:hypothetical protein
VGIAVLIWMPDSPVHAKFLEKEERIAAIERVRDDQGGTESKTLKKDQVIEALMDVRTWLIVISTLLSQFFLSFFIPSLQKWRDDVPRYLSEHSERRVE